MSQIMSIADRKKARLICRKKHSLFAAKITAYLPQKAQLICRKKADTVSVGFAHIILLYSTPDCAPP